MGKDDRATKKSPRKMTLDICDEVYNICLDICLGRQATCPDAEDIQSAVMEIPYLLEVDCVYELVVLAIQKAIESDNSWTEAQLTALEKARTYFENMEY